MTPQELKASILQLAIQGKLVEQRAEEGTAEELYQQIQKEKQRLIQDGVIKKEKPLPPICEDSVPFDIPDTWQWIRMADVGQLKNGYAFKSAEYVTDGIQVVRISDLEEDTISTKDAAYYTAQTDLTPYLIENDSFLICMTGSIGKMAWVRDNAPRYLNQRVGMFVPYGICNNSYIWYYLHTNHVIDGWIRAKTSTNGNIKSSDITELMLPLPPLAEQKRIVAKIEELLPYIDRYEQAWSRLEDFNRRFPVDMQKSILQMAIQGKLVEQRPEEGTGEELYQQIQQEKQRLIKAGTIKKEKPLPTITEDEIPFDIPDSWKWIRLGQVIDMLSGFAFRSPDFKANGRYRLLRGINLGVGATRWDDTVYVDEMPEKLDPYRIQKGDVLIGLDRPWISDGIRVAIFNDDEQTYLVQRVLRIRETCAITKEYIALLLRSNLFKNAVEGETTGISVPHISPGQVGSVAVPLPPLAEQKRIVAKLEEILPLCERLK